MQEFIFAQFNRNKKWKIWQDFQSHLMRHWSQTRDHETLVRDSREVSIQKSSLDKSHWDYILLYILPRLLQRSKECHGHYPTIYHAKSKWIMRTDTHLSFWHNVKKSVHLKFRNMWIAYRFRCCSNLTSLC